MMEFSTAAQWCLYICTFFMILLAIVTVGLLAGLVFGLKKLNVTLDRALDKAQPVIDKTTGVLDTVQRVTMNIGEKADHIMVKGEEIADNVAQRVETTAGVVEKTVTSPLIGFSSVLAGVSRGFQTFSKNYQNGNSTRNGK